MISSLKHFEPPGTILDIPVVKTLKRCLELVFLMIPNWRDHKQFSCNEDAAINLLASWNDESFMQTPNLHFNVKTAFSCLAILILKMRW